MVHSPKLHSFCYIHFFYGAHNEPAFQYTCSCTFVGLPISICYYCSLLSFHKAKGLNCSKAVEMLSCNNKSFNQFTCWLNKLLCIIKWQELVIQYFFLHVSVSSSWPRQMLTQTFFFQQRQEEERNRYRKPNLSSNAVEVRFFHSLFILSTKGFHRNMWDALENNLLSYFGTVLKTRVSHFEVFT